MSMEDKTIFGSEAGVVEEERIAFLNDCIKDVCASGDDISKYRKIIGKYFPEEPGLFVQLEELVSMVNEQKNKQKVTSTSLINIKFLASEAHISEKTVEELIALSLNEPELVIGEDAKETIESKKDGNLKTNAKKAGTENRSTLFSLSKLALGVSLIFLIFICSAFIANVSLIPPIGFSLSGIVPSITFVGLTITGWIFKKNIQLILWCGAIFWMVFYCLLHAYYDFFAEWYDVDSNPTVVLTTLLTIVAFITIMIIVVLGVNKKKLADYALYISALSASMFVVCHFLVISQVLTSLWYGIFAVAIIVIASKYQNTTNKTKALFMITSIVTGALMVEWFQGIYNYNYSYDFFVGFYQLVINGIIVCTCAILIIICMVIKDISEKAKAFWMFITILLCMADNMVTFDRYYVEITQEGVGFDGITYWYAGCAYPAACAFMSIHLCCYFVNLLQSERNQNI